MTESRKIQGTIRLELQDDEFFFVLHLEKNHADKISELKSLLVEKLRKDNSEAESKAKVETDLEVPNLSRDMFSFRKSTKPSLLFITPGSINGSTLMQAIKSIPGYRWTLDDAFRAELEIGVGRRTISKDFADDIRADISDGSLNDSPRNPVRPDLSTPPNFFKRNIGSLVLALLGFGAIFSWYFLIVPALCALKIAYNEYSSKGKAENFNKEGHKASVRRNVGGGSTGAMGIPPRLGPEKKHGEPQSQSVPDRNMRSDPITIVRAGSAPKPGNRSGGLPVDDDSPGSDDTLRPKGKS